MNDYVTPKQRLGGPFKGGFINVALGYRI